MTNDQHRNTKILYIITRLDRGGSAEAVMQWAEGMKLRGFDCKILTGRTVHPQEYFTAFSARTGVPVISLDTLRREVEPLNDIRALFALIRIIKKEKPDIVHTNTSKAGIIGRIAAKWSKIKVIIHSPHGHIFYGYYGRAKTALFILLEKYTAKFTRRITELTRLGIEDHIRRKIAPRQKFLLLYAGIDLEKFSHSARPAVEVRKELSIPQDALVIGWVGRLDTVKNPLLLIETAKLLKDEPRLHFLMVGDGELFPQAKRLIERYELQDRFTFTGHRSDVPELLPVMDIYVLTSLNEGLGRSILEAQSAGVPVIATEVGGVPEIIKHGENGLLIPSQSPADLAEAIMRLTTDHNLRYALSAKAKGTLPDFSLEKTLDDLQNLYNECLLSCRVGS